MSDLEHAKELLESGNLTCVLCREGKKYTSTFRGVRPWIDFLEKGINLNGFSVADRVVGKAAAYLMVLAGVKQVFARVMSEPAKEVFDRYKIGHSCDIVVASIINRAGTGPCPMESAVQMIDEPQKALAAIQSKLQELAG